MTQSSAAPGSPQLRHDRWKEVDPYPQIKPGLLNSAEIVDYVRTVGLIDPLHETEEKFKPASYEVDILGQVIRFEDGKKIEFNVKRGQPFDLPKNSIAFVEVEPTFRLPEYIAARFNLRIRHVYRGLLLGTGPLIDPGFVGKIYIPLHNLTSRDYELRGGEGLIWVEFTKLAPRKLRYSQTPVAPRSGRFFPFPPSKTDRTLDWYLRDAAPGGVVESSIPKEVATAKDAAVRAQRWNFFGVLGAAISFAALLVGFFTILADVHKAAVSDLRVAHELIGPLDQRREELNNRVEEFDRMIQRVSEQSELLDPALREVKSLLQGLEDLQARVLGIERELQLRSSQVAPQPSRDGKAMQSELGSDDAPVSR